MARGYRQNGYREADFYRPFGSKFYQTPSDGDPLPPGAPLLWYSARDADGRGNSTLSDGAAVANLTDKGSLGEDLTQATGSAQPAWNRIGEAGVINLPALSFDGGDYLQTAAFAALSQPLYFYALARFDVTTGADRVLADGDDGTNRTLFWYRDASTSLSLSAGTRIDGADPTVGNWSVYGYKANGASSAIYVDAAEDASGDGGANGIDGFTIGAGFAGASHFTGRMCEVLLYSADPGPSVVQSWVESIYGSMPRT